MQIGPSSSVLQALGSHPAAPEPARLKPAAHAEATAEVQRMAAPPAPVPVAPRDGVVQDPAAGGPGAPQAGRLLDIFV